MKVYMSTAFIYAVLAGIISVLLYVYYKKNTKEKYEKCNSLYNIAIFFLVSNIVYFSYKNMNETNVEFDRIFDNPNLEMKVGQPNF